MANDTATYAADVLKAITSSGPLSAPGFTLNKNAGGNKARLVSEMLRARLTNSKRINAKSCRWKGGVVAFKNFTPTIGFWSKVRPSDLNVEAGFRVWICSAIDKGSTLHVWVVPFDFIRDSFARLPKDKSGWADLQIVRNGAGNWSFRERRTKEGLPETETTSITTLDALHTEFSLLALNVFKDARAADAARRGSGAESEDVLPLQADAVTESEADKRPSEVEEVEIEGENRIYFGPPGTGKSHRVRSRLKGEAQDDAAGRVRTVTFHPEYTYSDFVGSYRPGMVYGGDEKYLDPLGNIVRPIGRPVVVYRFVPGPLIQMICRAMLNQDVHFYLVIEEINRGNCAAIFGDLFQLLDRQEGESQYAVWVEPELMAHVREQVTGQVDRYIQRRLDSEGLFLPFNLSILATMNTSDQSLYPMDAAMKRRWEMEYVPVDYEEAKGRMVELPDGAREWDAVLRQLNDVIVKMTQADDKQIGQWFVQGNPITRETFRNKVLSYLWFDVFRHNPHDIFDLGGDAAAYESLVKRYDDGKPVFKRLLFDTPAGRTGGESDGN